MCVLKRSEDLNEDKEDAAWLIASKKLRAANRVE